MAGNIPDTLSTITQLPAPKPGEAWSRRNRRPRNLIPGTRANTRAVTKPGEKIFRINPDPAEDPRLRAEFLDSQAGRAMLRAWAPLNDYTVSPRGKIPAEVRAAFVKQKQEELDRHRAAGHAAMRDWGLRHGYKVRARGEIPPEVRAGFMEENDIWTVQVVSALLPGAKDFSQHYHVRQGGYDKKRTIYPHVIMRAMGREMWNLLWEVT